MGNLGSQVRRELVDAGVHVVLTPNTGTANYVHEKVIIIHGTRARLGSQNATPTSLEDNG